MQGSSLQLGCVVQDRHNKFYMMLILLGEQTWDVERWWVRSQDKGFYLNQNSVAAAGDTNALQSKEGLYSKIGGAIFPVLKKNPRIFYISFDFLSYLHVATISLNNFSVDDAHYILLKPTYLYYQTCLLITTNQESLPYRHGLVPGYFVYQVRSTNLYKTVHQMSKLHLSEVCTPSGLTVATVQPYCVLQHLTKIHDLNN